jgi:capsular polysaccharide export protein
MVNLFKKVLENHSRVLMLQGPVGPFFANLAHDLRSVGGKVSKINFHGGDWLFYPSNTTNFRRPMDEWAGFLERFLITNQIDLILLFGDCRPHHLVARDVALKLGITLGVFEEGYARPDYITLENYGVNAHSEIPKDPNFYIGKTDRVPSAERIGPPFFYAMVWAMLYNSAASLLKPFFYHYRHHRNLSIFDGICWLRSFWRKQIYKISERFIQDFLIKKHSGNFYIVPLQVGNDSQIHSHSRFESVQEFIVEVMVSFSKYSPSGTLLVIKQHPLERGYSNHGEFIEAMARELNILDRVIYCHDQHLPTLLKHAKGCVVINSTVGMSAIGQSLNVKCLGDAVYNMPGLTFQGELDDFWKASGGPDLNLYKAFHSYVINKTQINGNYYRRLPVPNIRSGVLWK